MSNHTNPAMNAMKLLGLTRWFVSRAERNQLERERDLARRERDIAREERHEATEKWIASSQEVNRIRFNAERAERERAEAVKARNTAIQMRDEALEETRKQVELNAELLQQGFGITVDAQAHSLLVDPERVQVLTQLTARKLDLRHGMLSALFNPFALNVARHLVKKLGRSGHVTEGTEARIASSTRLLEYKDAPMTGAQAGGAFHKRLT